MHIPEKCDLTQKQLQKALNYNEQTGIFTWKDITGTYAQIGDIAGKIDSEGYIQIPVVGKRKYAHRLAFLYMEGYFPEGLVDHKDRVKHHNWWDNLRETSAQCNARNSRTSKNSKSGIKGVYWAIANKKWVAQITLNRKCYSLGYYVSKEDAICARLAAEQCVDWAGCDSNSPAYKYVKESVQ